MHTYLTKNIRNPEVIVKDPAILRYQTLVWNGMSELLARAFPILHSLYTQKKWLALIQDFYARHSATSPLFQEVPQEFLQYLKKRHDEEMLPFLLELAHFEWTELALELAEDTWLSPNPFVSPFVWLLQYRFPVHQIVYQHNEPVLETPTYLLAYRNSQYVVHYLEINLWTAHVMQQLLNAPTLTPTAALDRVLCELHEQNNPLFYEEGQAMLLQLSACGILTSL